MEENLKIDPIYLKLGICGFSGLLITNPVLIFKNSRWRSQYEGQFFLITGFTSHLFLLYRGY